MFDYSFHINQEKECVEMLHYITQNTKVLQIPAEDINIWSVKGISKGNIVFYSFYPTDVLSDESILESARFLDRDFQFSFSKEKFIKIFKSSGFDSLIETGFMFNYKDEDNMTHYLIPTPDFMATYAKFLDANGSLMRKTDIFKDIFLARELYEHEFLNVICRKFATNGDKWDAWDMYSVVTSRYSLVPQTFALDAIKMAKENMKSLNGIEFLDARLTDSHSYLNYVFHAEERMGYLAGFQILLSDIGDASTTVTSFVRFGNLNVYSDKKTFAHSRPLSVEDLHFAILDCCKHSLEILDKVKKTFRKKVVDPKQYFNYIYQKANLQKAYGSGIAEGACENIYKSFVIPGKTTWSRQEVWTQLVRIMNYPENEITFSTMESVRKASGKALELIMDENDPDENVLSKVKVKKTSKKRGRKKKSESN